MGGIIGEQIGRTETILCTTLKISVPPWAAPCPARAHPTKVLKSKGTPRHAQGPLSIGTGTPNHMTGVPGRACAWACQAHGTDMARPGQSLDVASCLTSRSGPDYIHAQSQCKPYPKATGPGPSAIHYTFPHLAHSL